MPYAERTQVAVSKSKTEIEAVLKKYGATGFMYFSEAERAIIVFVAKERRIRFDLPIPKNAREQEERRCWRAMFLCIKAKLESVASGIETFEEAFLAHVMLPDGKTVAQHTMPRIAQAYQGGEMPPLLPGPSS